METKRERLIRQAKERNARPITQKELSALKTRKTLGNTYIEAETGPRKQAWGHISWYAGH